MSRTFSRGGHESHVYGEHSSVVKFTERNWRLESTLTDRSRDNLPNQAELAVRLDVSRQAVNAIETGKHDPSLQRAFRIARLFNLSIEEVLDDGQK